MRKKLSFLAAFLLAAAVLFSAVGFAGLRAYADSGETEASFDKAEYSKITEAGYMALIYDEAELMTTEEEWELGENYLLPIAEYYGNVMMITVHSDGTEISTLGDQLYDRLIGDGENGILFTIDMTTRQLGLWADGTVLNTIKPGVADTIMDNCYRYASRGDYDGCGAAVFEQVYDKLGGKYIPEPMKWASAAVLAAIIGAFLTYIATLLTGRKKAESKAAILESAMRADRIQISNVNIVQTGTRKVYDPPEESGSGGRSGGGGFSGGGGGGFSGGGGGGGSSGGGGSHGF